jgi:hypothetical protein
LIHPDNGLVAKIEEENMDLVGRRAIPRDVQTRRIGTSEVPKSAFRQQASIDLIPLPNPFCTGVISLKAHKVKGQGAEIENALEASATTKLSMRENHRGRVRAFRLTWLMSLRLTTLMNDMHMTITGLIEKKDIPVMACLWWRP